MAELFHPFPVIYFENECYSIRFTFKLSKDYKDYKGNPQGLQGIPQGL